MNYGGDSFKSKHHWEQFINISLYQTMIKGYIICTDFHISETIVCTQHFLVLSISFLQLDFYQRSIFCPSIQGKKGECVDIIN